MHRLAHSNHDHQSLEESSQLITKGVSKVAAATSSGICSATESSVFIGKDAVVEAATLGGIS
jgi:hypothetical protein